MTDHVFHIVNVFAESPLGGNPLCVFEDASGLDEATMQALALQFNLSETTFVFRSDRADARVRIFTPTFEMPFAGHPTLGTAHVVRATRAGHDSLLLEMIAGVIPVQASGDVWTLEARSPSHRRADATPDEIAQALGLSMTDVGPDPLWVDTGSEQLVIPVASREAVRRALPDAKSMLRHLSNGTRAMAYVFHREGDDVLARFFFPKHGAVVEDPGTGSACANLGGWLIATGAKLPARIVVAQGEFVGRPCRLGLEVTSERRIRVSGRVVAIGRGRITLPATR